MQLVSEKKDNALHYACRLGRTNLVEVLLNSGHFNVNEPNFSKDSCLTVACDNGHLETVSLLIVRGADPNYENEKEKTPLILATELNDPCDIKLVNLLISNGAQVTKATSNGNNVLYNASLYANLKLIDLLMLANADLEMKNNDGTNSLMRACVFNHFNLVKYFIEHGANIESENMRKETPLYLASFKGYLSIVKLLVEK